MPTVDRLLSFERGYAKPDTTTRQAQEGALPSSDELGLAQLNQENFQRLCELYTVVALAVVGEVSTLFLQVINLMNQVHR